MSVKNQPLNMTILFTRHAIALDHAIAQRKKISDDDRPLTPAGIRAFEAIIQRHKKKIKKTDLYMSSPLLRAQQTLALMMTSKKSRKHKPKNYKYIRHSDSPSQFLKWIKKTKFENIVAVSHEPYMSHFMAALFGDQWLNHKIKKGQIIKIKFSGEKISYKLLPL